MPRVVPSQVVDLIDTLFPLSDQRRIVDTPRSRLVALLAILDQIPEELIILDGNQYSMFVTSVSEIRTAIEERRGAISIGPVFERDARNAIQLLRGLLNLCPDEFPSTDTAELSFINKRDLRDNLRIDISAMNKALSNGEWKAATVLAGSVIEALLLWALEQRPAEIPKAIAELSQRGTPISDASKSLESWHLPSYIEVAAELKVIRADTATQARLAKDYRNLIHPGRAARLGQACNRGTALSTVAAFELVVRDLT